MRSLLVLPSIGVLLVGGCRASEPPQSSMKPAVSVAQLMQGVIDPAADVVWAAVGTIVTQQGVEEIFPKNDEEWAAVRNSAIILAESGNLLMIAGRARDSGDWMVMSRALTDAGLVAVKAAEARNPDAILAVGEQVYDSCNNCHRRYWQTTPQ